MPRTGLGTFTAPTMSRVNFWYNQLFYGLSAFAGSVTSFFLNGALIWAFVRLAQGRISLIVDWRIRLLACVFALYPLSELWSTIINGRGTDGLIASLGQIVFLAVLPVASRLVVSKPKDILASAGQGAAAAGCVAFVYSIVENNFLGVSRTEAGYGNPAVMGVIALTLACLCLVALTVSTGRQRAFLQIGALSAIGALLLSGTRSVWLVAPISLVAAAWPWIRELSMKLNGKNLALAAVALAILAVVAAPMVTKRFNETLLSMDNLETGGYDASIGQRLTLWRAGFSQAVAKPWTGYGPDSVKEMILSIKPTGSLGYTHYHNFVLNSLIRGGIPELLALLAIPAALIWLAFRRSANAQERAGRALLLSLCTTFYLTGLVGILFTHDIVNATFVYTAIIGACLATGTYTPESKGNRLVSQASLNP